MSLLLESWYTLDEVTFTTDLLVIRLVPDHFSSEIVEPVLTLTVTGPDDELATQQSLVRFREEFIGWPNFVFAFHDGEELGPLMLSRIAKHTGLRPEDL